ncbi:hypothetical protein MMC07_004478 [Pseudocyphellaria aurata]|nr:hypothetical protein [Pseudocyphellaria aurata]
MNPLSCVDQNAVDELPSTSCEKDPQSYADHNAANKVLPLRCHLLTLPAEIKHMIYQQVPDTWDLRPLNSEGRSSVLKFKNRNDVPYVINCGITGWVRFDRVFDPSLLQTCREIYFEAQPIFYRQLEIYTQFKDLAGFDQMTRTLNESPFRNVRAVGLHIWPCQLSRYPKASNTRLKKALQAMPYLKDVGEITTIHTVHYARDILREPLVANPVELNDSIKPIRGARISSLTFLMCGPAVIERLTGA